MRVVFCNEYYETFISIDLLFAPEVVTVDIASSKSYVLSKCIFINAYDLITSMFYRKKYLWLMFVPQTEFSFRMM